MPQETASSAVLRSYSVYTLARLKADPVTADLVDGLDKAQTMLQGAAAATDASSDAYLEALAARDACDLALDSAVVRAGLAALQVAGNRRESASYRRLFPAGTTAITTLPLADEIVAVRLLEGRLAEETEGTGPKAAPPAVVAARQAAEAALARLSETTLTQGAARAAELTAREEWRRVMRKVFGELTVRFPDDRRQVESYFRAARVVHTDVTVSEPVTPAVA